MGTTSSENTVLENERISQEVHIDNELLSEAYAQLIFFSLLMNKGENK